MKYGQEKMTMQEYVMLSKEQQLKKGAGVLRRHIERNGRAWVKEVLDSEKFCKLSTRLTKELEIRKDYIVSIYVVNFWLKYYPELIIANVPYYLKDERDEE